MPRDSQPYADGRQPEQDRLPVADRLDDDHFPAYTMGRAAELVGTTPAFLRALGEARLITPARSGGGHRRYSRHQLRLAARARELTDRGTGRRRVPHHQPRGAPGAGRTGQRGAAPAGGGRGPRTRVKISSRRNRISSPAAEKVFP
ncbi:hypothetical protein GCM10010293_14610 [Streptomyces griseoflavus]|nr:hypothetical protein GCM10010293_14610 [Streptomyces griseoflavus]